MKMCSTSSILCATERDKRMELRVLFEQETCCNTDFLVSLAKKQHLEPDKGDDRDEQWLATILFIRVVKGHHQVHGTMTHNSQSRYNFFPSRETGGSLTRLTILLDSERFNNLARSLFIAFQDDAFVKVWKEFTLVHVTRQAARMRTFKRVCMFS